MTFLLAAKPACAAAKTGRSAPPRKGTHLPGRPTDFCEDAAMSRSHIFKEVASVLCRSIIFAVYLVLSLRWLAPFWLVVYTELQLLDSDHKLATIDAYLIKVRDANVSEFFWYLTIAIVLNCILLFSVWQKLIFQKREGLVCKDKK
jgi:hypothetical protein